MQQQLSLLFAKDDTFQGELFHLELFGVRKFLLEQPPLSLFNLYLTIEKIEDIGEQASRFTVYNSEQDVKFVCSCRDFIAAIVEGSRRYC